MTSGELQVAIDTIIDATATMHSSPSQRDHERLPKFRQ